MVQNVQIIDQKKKMQVIDKKKNQIIAEKYNLSTKKTQDIERVIEKQFAAVPGNVRQ